MMDYYNINQNRMMYMVVANYTGSKNVTAFVSRCYMVHFGAVRSVKVSSFGAITYNVRQINPPTSLPHICYYNEGTICFNSSFTVCSQ